MLRKFSSKVLKNSQAFNHNQVRPFESQNNAQTAHSVQLLMLCGAMQIHGNQIQITSLIALEYFTVTS